MKLAVRNVKPDDARIFKCEYYEVKAHKNSCFFCEHCTDIFFDYTNGPYMFFCLKDHDDVTDYLINGCPDFKEGYEE